MGCGGCLLSDFAACAKNSPRVSLTFTILRQSGIWLVKG